MNFKLKIDKNEIDVQTEKLADQASGCCLIRMGETSLLCVSQQGKERSDLNFFPLTCNYEEKFYAAGKILGSRFIRREGRPSTKAVLNSRMIDRTIRPLFPKELKKEIQITSSCLSWDSKNGPIIPALIGTSIALSISDIPWQGPIGAVRVAKIAGNLVLNPTYEERENSDFEIIISGIEEKGEILVNMIEFQGKEVEEKIVLESFDFALPYLKDIIDFQKDLVKKIGKKKSALPPLFENKEIEKNVKKFLTEKLEKVIYQKDNQERSNGLESFKEEIFEKMKENISNPEEEKNNKISLIESILEKETERIIKETILNSPDDKEKRPDGRKLDEIRKIETDIGLLPRVHGSGLFTRGKTRVLSVLTLGAPGDEQLMDEMEISAKKGFLHHYNFPAYSSGETGPARSPGRREIGHGALAEKTISPLLPNKDDFPYTIRIVSEILSSNGSTSMASVSGACLALMDGGVPIKGPAAGVAMGLVKEGKKYKILTDIQGPEDHYGDMDFKIAGTEKGITAMQMDVKIRGIDKKIIEETLERAKTARLEILKTQNKTISTHRENLSPFAPRVYVLSINPEKIGTVIGPGGKMINKIIEECDVSIDIEDSGKVFVTSKDKEMGEKAIEWVKNLTREIVIGEIFQGKVKRIFGFGAMVEILPGQEGLVHISEFSDSRIEKVEDAVKIGDIVPVKVVGIDDQDRINLSAKQAGFKIKKKENV